jgi:hypothetical protein
MNTPHTQLTDTEADFLRPLRELVSEYPPDLLAARRAAFLWLLYDPDRVTIKTQPVSEQTDERNSRPAPY